MLGACTALRSFKFVCALITTPKGILCRLDAAEQATWCCALNRRHRRSYRLHSGKEHQVNASTPSTPFAPNQCSCCALLLCSSLFRYVGTRGHMFLYPRLPMSLAMICKFPLASGQGNANANQKGFFSRAASGVRGAQHDNPRRWPYCAALLTKCLVHPYKLVPDRPTVMEYDIWHICAFLAVIYGLGAAVLFALVQNGFIELCLASFLRRACRRLSASETSRQNAPLSITYDRKGLRNVCFFNGSQCMSINFTTELVCVRA